MSDSNWINDAKKSNEDRLRIEDEQRRKKEREEQDGIKLFHKNVAQVRSEIEKVISIARSQGLIVEEAEGYVWAGYGPHDRLIGNALIRVSRTICSYCEVYNLTWRIKIPEKMKYGYFLIRLGTDYNIPICVTQKTLEDFERITNISSIEGMIVEWVKKVYGYRY